MSGQGWRLGEHLSIREDGKAWTAFRVVEMNDGGLSLHDPLTGRSLWVSRPELARLFVQRSLRRERVGAYGISPLARKLLGSDLASRPEPEREHVRKLAPYIIAFSKSGSTRHASRKELEALIRRVAAENAHVDAPKWRTISNHIRLWKSTLADGRCLAPRISARGNLTQRFKGFEPILAKIIEDNVLVRNRLSAKGVHSAARTALAQYNLDAAPEDRVVFELGRRTIERRIAALTKDVRQMATGGPQAVRNRCTVVGVHEQPTRPLEVVQIDHTPLDCFVVHPETCKSIGRPYVTVVIDLFSRMVVGIIIGFGEPSYRSVMLALRSAMLPKSDILAKYGLAPEAWPCWGGLDTLVMDNGPEFHGADIDDALSQLTIDRRWCKAGGPYQKGTTERWFRRLNAELVHSLPGTTFSNSVERADYEPEKKAKLTLAEVRRLVVKWIVTDYAIDVHEGIGEAPIVRWRRGVEADPVDLPCEVEDLDVLLLPAAPVALTRKGISVHGLQYGGLGRDGRLQELLNAADKPDKCLVKTNPDDLGYVHLLDWQTGKYIPLQCNTFSAVDGMTLFEWKVAAEKSRRELKEYQSVSFAQLDKTREQTRTELQALVKTDKARGRKAARLTAADEDVPALPPLARARPVKPPQGRAGFTMPAAADPSADLGITLDTLI